MFKKNTFFCDECHMILNTDMDDGVCCNKKMVLTHTTDGAGVSFEPHAMPASGGVEGSVEPENLRRDFRRLIQVHIESYKHNTKDKRGFFSEKARHKLEAMESFLESAIKSNLVEEEF